ncbi:response regulator [Candidatus Latescibacterota bacterium]
MSEKRVLIVDDEQDMIDITEAMLSEIEGIVILSAQDGDSGLAKAKEIKPDLMILDVQMPGKTGFDVFVALQKDELTKHIPVIMLTGVREKTGFNFSASHMKEWFGVEPNAYIEKPVDPGTLQSLVVEILGL